MKMYTQMPMFKPNLKIESRIGSNDFPYYICRPALSRENISTEENVLVSRVVFEGKRAVGVEYSDRGAGPAAEKKVARGAEIIVCGGAVNSPQLLMLSGVGDETHLKVGWSISYLILKAGQTDARLAIFWLLYN